MSATPSELELAFGVEPIVGWRIWRVARGVDRNISALELAKELFQAERDGDVRPVEAIFRHRLRSLSESTIWRPYARIEATCMVGDRHGPAPVVSCECGIWAFREHAAAAETLNRYAHTTGAVALGRVALWGRIVEHEAGWRGQYAYPVDLVLFGGDAPIRRELTEAYGCDVAIGDRLSRSGRASPKRAA